MARTAARARQDLIALSTEGHDLTALWEAAAEPLSALVPHWNAPCWFSLDPASLLITSHYSKLVPQLPREALVAEYYGDDVNRLVDVARSGPGASTLHDATGGRPERSRRWQENRRLGADQELIVALRSGGQVWGALGLYRAPGEPLFSNREIDDVRAVAPYLAEAARRALLLGEATEPDSHQAPGLLILDADATVCSMTSGTDELVRDLPDGDWEHGRLPSAVLAVHATARATLSPEARPAFSRVLTKSGTWLALHGAPLASDASGKIAVIIEPAHPARLAPLLMSAYGFTAREQDVTRLVLQGSSTTEIAQSLHVSPHTVQQHLKSVFEKTGVHSRRDLVGRIFFAHYEPRLRDNERRVAQGRPVRGGPAPAAP